MQDVVARVPTLSFIDVANCSCSLAPAGRAPKARSRPATVSACRRAIRATTSGAIGHERRITRRSRVVRHQVADGARSDARRINYMISFALPRFCDQSLDRVAEGTLLSRCGPAGSPSSTRSCTSCFTSTRVRTASAGSSASDGTYSAHCHGQRFFEQVAEMVTAVPRQPPRPGDLRLPARRFRPRSRRGTAAWSAPSFRSFPSFPQRYVEALPSSCRATGRRRRAASSRFAGGATSPALHRGRPARPRSSSTRLTPRLGQGATARRGVRRRASAAAAATPRRIRST